jgi:hypothetical protein
MRRQVKSRRAEAPAISARAIRTWSFEIKGGTFSRYAAGVRVQVRLAPRTMKLLDVTVEGPPALPGTVTPAWPPESSRSSPG